MAMNSDWTLKKAALASDIGMVFNALFDCMVVACCYARLGVTGMRFPAILHGRRSS